MPWTAAGGESGNSVSGGSDRDVSLKSPTPPGSFDLRRDIAGETVAGAKYYTRDRDTEFGYTSPAADRSYRAMIDDQRASAISHEGNLFLRYFPNGLCQRQNCSGKLKFQRYKILYYVAIYYANSASRGAVRNS